MKLTSWYLTVDDLFSEFSSHFGSNTAQSTSFNVYFKKSQKKIMQIMLKAILKYCCDCCLYKTERFSMKKITKILRKEILMLLKHKERHENSVNASTEILWWIHCT